MNPIKMKWSVALMMTALLSQSAFAKDNKPKMEAKYNTLTWKMPRQVLDLTVTYTFDSCDEEGTIANIKGNVAAAIVPRSIADPTIKTREVTVEELLGDNAADANVDVKTSAGSHTLTYIGSIATDQTAAIVGNVLSGVVTLAGVALGVPSSNFLQTVSDRDLNQELLDLLKSAPTIPAPATGQTSDQSQSKKSVCGPAKDAKENQKTVGDAILKLQASLAKDDLPDDQRTKLTTRLTSLQSLNTALSSDFTNRYTLTIKRTIDPGFTPIELIEGSDIQAQAKMNQDSVGGIDKSGIIGSVIPTLDELKKAGWYSKDSDAIFDIPDSLRVSVYLDFALSEPKARVNDDTKQINGSVKVLDGAVYRDPTYVPVLAFTGPKFKLWNALGTTEDGRAEELQKQFGKSDLTNKRVINPQRVAFPQFGVGRGLPFSAGQGSNITWTISFAEDGEITESTFISKSRLQAMTSLFKTGASAANAFATEARTAHTNSSETMRLNAENTELQAQIDNITKRQQLNKLLNPVQSGQ